jgi:uncharacterized small protein (DUF1192 family)
MSMHKKIKVFRILILVTFLIVVSGGLLLSIFKMEDVVYAYGEVGGINDYEFKSMVDGKITEILKDDGAHVKQGEIILKLDSTELEDRIEMIKSSIAEIEAELKVKEDSLGLLSTDPLPTHYRNIEIELDEARKRLDKSVGKLERCKDLFDRNVISKTEFENIEVEYIKSKATKEKAESDFNKVSQGMGEKIISQAENEMKLLKIKLENRWKELKLLEKHLADYTIKAPEGGVVIHMPYKPDTLRELREVHRQCGWPEPAHEFTDMHDWGDMLVQAGFAEPVMDMERITLTYINSDKLLADLRALGRNLHRQRFQGLRGKSWLAHWHQALLKLAQPANGGPLSLSFEVVYGHAMKPQPRMKVSAESQINLSDMRQMLRNSQKKPNQV